MRLARGFASVVSGLVIVAGTLLSSATTFAATASDGLATWVARPGGTWADTVTVAPGETINIYISYTNMNTSGQKYVMLTDALPSGASFSPGSAYLYTPAVPSATKQADTLTTTGISTGALRPGEKAGIQFQATMPTAANLSCGVNKLKNVANGTSRTGNRTYTASAKIVVKRDCSTPTPPPTPAPTTSPTAATTSTPSTSLTVVSIDASVHDSYNTTSSPQVASASTTAKTTDNAPTSADAATDDQPKTQQNQASADAKSLVSTGPGNIIAIFLAAVAIGAVGSRLVLYRLLRA